MDILSYATKFAMAIAVMSLITMLFQKFGTEGFYLTLISLVVSLTISIIGIIIRLKKNKKEENCDEIE